MPDFTGRWTDSGRSRAGLAGGWICPLRLRLPPSRRSDQGPAARRPDPQWNAGASLPKGIERLFLQGVSPLIDIWNVEILMSPLMPDSRGGLTYFAERVQQTLLKLGEGEKPLWWLSGCPGMTDAKMARPWALGKNRPEVAQAEWVQTVFAVAEATGVDCVIWQDAIDTPCQTGTGRDFFGLLRADGSPKPASVAFQALTSPGLIA